MLETLMKLCRQFLQLHSGAPRIRRLGPPSDEAVNLFLDVDERLFQGVFSLSHCARHSKQHPIPSQLTINGNYLSFFNK